MTTPIFTNWDQARHPSLWGKHNVKLEHNLHENELFSIETLAELIDAYPREKYNLVHMAKPGAKRKLWREGEIGDNTGKDVINAIRDGRIWVNLRDLETVDPRYKDLMESVFSELQGYMPEFETFKERMGVLISSPNAQVYYHADVPGQALWQIAGRKKIYIYPNEEPFLRKQDLEGIILGETEEEIEYQPWFDDYAEIVELAPGQMLHWPLNGPHRVENLDMMNISITTEHYTTDIRRSYAVNYGNGVLRRRMGLNPKSNSLRGAAFYPKAAIAAATKLSGIQKNRQFQRKVDFRVDPNAKDGMVDIPAYTI
jgi:hypothetical protein